MTDEIFCMAFAWNLYFSYRFYYQWYANPIVGKEVPLLPKLNLAVIVTPLLIGWILALTNILERFPSLQSMYPRAFDTALIMIVPLMWEIAFKQSVKFIVGGAVLDGTFEEAAIRFVLFSLITCMILPGIDVHSVGGNLEHHDELVPIAL